MNRMNRFAPVPRQRFHLWSIIQTNFNPGICAFRTSQSLDFDLVPPEYEREGISESHLGRV